MWLSTVVKPDAMEQVLKAGIIAHGVEEGVHFQELQNV
jgi:hypothetical protein